METVNDITREMRVELDQSWWDIDREKIHDMPDRLDAAHKWVIEGLNDGIVERDEYIAKLTSENGRLRDALKEAIPFSCLKCTIWNSRAARCSRGSGMCNQVWKWKTILGEVSKSELIKKGGV